MIDSSSVVISFIIGIIAAVVGMGGGFLFVPSLSLLYNLDTRVAVGTSLAVMVFSSVSASFIYSQKKKILYILAIVLIIPAMLFSALGSVLTQSVDPRVLAAAFSIVLIVISLQMVFTRFRFGGVLNYGPYITCRVGEEKGEDHMVKVPYVHLIAWGVLGGLISGITGVSGGVCFVPALVLAGIPVHVAVATSLFAIIFPSLTGAATHAALGQISPGYVVLYGVGAATGAYVGAWFAPRIKGNHIRQIFGIILIIVAFIMIQQKVLIG